MSTSNGARKTADFRDKYLKDDDSVTSCKEKLKTLRCDKKYGINLANRLVPSYRIIKNYQWRADIFKDLICGITIGIMQLPQGKWALQLSSSKVQ